MIQNQGLVAPPQRLRASPAHPADETHATPGNPNKTLVGAPIDARAGVLRTSSTPHSPDNSVGAPFFTPIEVRLDGFCVSYSGGNLSASRNGRPWRDLAGDGLVLSLTLEVARLRRLLSAGERVTVDPEALGHAISTLRRVDRVGVAQALLASAVRMDH